MICPRCKKDIVFMEFKFKNEEHMQRIRENGHLAEALTKDMTMNLIDEWDKRLSTGKYNVITIYGEQGCLSKADTTVKMVDDSVKFRDLRHGQTFKTLSYNLDNNRIEDDTAIYLESGKKEIFEIILESGKKIYASEDHGFLSETGGWVCLKNLKIGDSVMVNE